VSLRLASTVLFLSALAGCGSGASSTPTASGNPQTSGNGGGNAEVAATREIWTPYVIPSTRTEPVLYEVVTTGRPGTVTLTVDATTIALRDDGQGGDKVAGDGTWSVQLPVAAILAKNTPDRVNRPLIGALRLNGSPSTYNVIAEVWTPDLGTRSATPIPGGQETDYLVNYTASTEQLTRFDPAFWARTFYANHPDEFDFLNFVLVGGVRENRHHRNLRIKVSGLGVDPNDVATGWGSAARLQGVNVYPLSSTLDHGAKGFLHETAHQWVSYLKMTPFGPANPHWPKGSVATGIMGFSMPPGAVGGEFPFSFTGDGKGGYVAGPQDPMDRTTFSMIELYMMGLAGPDEVPEYFVLKNQVLDLAPGQVLGINDIEKIRVADIIASAGPRVPGVATSQKAFRSATIILSERPLDTPAISLYDYFVRRGEARVELPCSEGVLGGLTCKPWYLATRGRSTMSLRIR